MRYLLSALLFPGFCIPLLPHIMVYIAVGLDLQEQLDSLLQLVRHIPQTGPPDGVNIPSINKINKKVSPFFFHIASFKLVFIIQIDNSFNFNHQSAFEDLFLFSLFYNFYFPNIPHVEVDVEALLENFCNRTIRTPVNLNFCANIFFFVLVTAFVKIKLALFKQGAHHLIERTKVKNTFILDGNTFRYHIDLKDHDRKKGPLNL